MSPIEHLHPPPCFFSSFKLGTCYFLPERLISDLKGPKKGRLKNFTRVDQVSFSFLISDRKNFYDTKRVFVSNEILVIFYCRTSRILHIPVPCYVHIYVCLYVYVFVTYICVCSYIKVLKLT